MDDRVLLFLRQTGPVLCVDIGAMTQNGLLARPGWDCGEWPRFTMPSPALKIAQRIQELTLLKCGLWLYGKEMGGGFGHALRAHLAAGLPASATETAAKSIHHDPEAVINMGIQIAEFCPPGSVPIHTGDFDPAFWACLLRETDLPAPHMILACAQDHGNPAEGARTGRMHAWRALLQENNDPATWIYEKAPEKLTRLKSLQQCTGGPVADSATCAILGALCEPSVFERCGREGVTIINAGNTHTLAALVYRAKVCGIYEHHTAKRDLKLLMADLDQFRLHWLPEEEVHASGGHGAAYGEECAAAGGYTPTFILGPKRALLRDRGTFIAPHGDMIHAGCFGLLYGWSRIHAKIGQ